METICDSCGIIIPEGDDRFTVADGATLCGACYDDFCIYCFEDGEPC